MSKKTHKLRGVRMWYKDRSDKWQGVTVSLTRRATTDVLYQGNGPLPENFDNMHEHERLYELAKAGMPHTPQYT